MAKPPLWYQSGGFAAALLNRRVSVRAAVERLHYAIAAAIFLIALTVFILTLAPSVAFIDSGLLTVAAWSGGNAHPPGFPLYLLLTKLIMLLPLRSIAWRANLASALFAAGACAMVALATAEALLYAPAVPGKKKKSAVAPPSSLKVALGMAIAGLLLLFGRTLWGYATIAEVYALNTFLLAAILWMVLRWRRTRAARDLYIAAAVSGLALGVHHVTVGITLIAVAVFVLKTGKFSREVRVAIVIAFVAGIAVYAYLPIAASHEAALNWGDPSNAKQIWQHVSAAQFRSFMKTSAGSSQLGVIARLIGREFGPPRFPGIAILAVIGLFAMLRRDRALLLLALLTIGGCCAWMLVYPIQNDRDAYLLPAFLVIAVATAYGAATLAGRKPALMAAFLALPAIATIMHWPYRDRSEWRVPQRYVENAFRPIRENALLITSAEQLYTPLFYLQEVERVRPDIRTLNWELLMRWWYIDTMERKYPSVFDPARGELNAFRPSLAMFRDNPEAYNVPSIRQQTNDRYDRLILAIIRGQIAQGVNVYLTHELAFSRQTVNQSFVRQLASEWNLVPVGIAVAVLPRGFSHLNAGFPMNLEGLVPPAMRYEDDDIVNLEVIPAYRDALLFRARHLAFAARDREAAQRDYRQALALDPDNEAIQNELRAFR